MARVRHIVPDPSDDNLRLVIFSDLVTDICMLLLLLEPEFECIIEPCSLLRERERDILQILRVPVSIGTVASDQIQGVCEYLSYGV